jgi:glutamate formiminotransferase/glutamate formiminotransferase/formiminotetrahydrofolate cyclodeaminase
MSVPNVSEGIDEAALAAIASAFAPARCLDIHSDPDHHRSVFTLVSRQGELATALARGAREATARVSIAEHAGIHPHVGAVDVVPVVYLDAARRGAACAEALTTADLIARATDVPVFLYGELAGGRERAEVRRGGTAGLAERIANGEIAPDFGPDRLHTGSGATLVGARPPMVAFNIDLAPGETLETAKTIAAELRESGGGLPGVRAIGLRLDSRGLAQVSCNVHDPLRVPLGEIVEFVRARAPIAHAELVGLTPRTAVEGFPEDVEFLGFDAMTSVIEVVLARQDESLS